MRQPRTFREAENFARLTQTGQQSIKESQGGDALNRMQQQLDTMVSTMTKRSSKPEATVTAYQFSPQHTTALDNKVIHLEGKIDQQVRMVGNRPQEFQRLKLLLTNQSPHNRQMKNCGTYKNKFVRKGA